MSDSSGSWRAAGRRRRRGPPPPLASDRSDGSDSADSGDSADSNSNNSADSGPRRTKRRRVILASDDESDASGAESDHPKDEESKPVDAKGSDAGKSPKKNDYRSDNSENDEKCPICLFIFSSQQIGTPDTCEHVFCSDCLAEWSNHVNTCPVDRKEFTCVLVRNKIGGKVIKTIPVKPRRISLDDLVEEEPTICQICRSSDSEDTMLLCDQCDLGFHMECLDPPLHQIPADDWYCPGCIAFNEIDSGDEPITTLATNPSHSSTTGTRSSLRTGSVSQSLNQDTPSTSTSNARNRSVSTRNVRTNSLTNSNRTIVKRRRRRRVRKTRTAVVEYEIRDGEKFPIKTKKYATKKRKRKVKRTSRATRTAARRAIVRSSVKGRLAEFLQTPNSGSSFRNPLSNIVAPRLSIFGDRNELDLVVSEDEDFGDCIYGNGTSVRVASRSHASALLDAHRQSRRKIVSLPSPTYASSAPDLLSSIMESQSMFHSKSSTMSVNRDGSIIVKVPRNTNTVKNTNPDTKPSEEKAIDLRKPDQNVQTKSNPSYGSSGRGGNNWRGGRGDYHSGNNGNRSGRSYSGNTYHQGNNSGNYRDNGNYSGNDYNNSGGSFFNSNDSWMNNASRNQPPRDHYSNIHDRSSHQRSNSNNNRGRGTQPRYSPQVPRSRSFAPWQQQNYSDSSMPPNETTSESYSCDPDSNNASTTSNDESNYVIDRVNPERVTENRPLGVYQVSDERINSTNNPTLPQPPIIRFEKPSLSDDEKAETECAAAEGDKYDPTEPTIDDSSSDNDVIIRPANAQNKITIISPPSANLSEKDSTSSTSSPSHPPDSLNLSDKALDNVVQQMLTDHEDLITACVLNDEKDDKDVESDVDAECPNFSIYSSASMDIAKNKEKSLDSEMEQNNDMVTEDLVQEDDADIIPDIEKLSSDFGSDNKLPTPEDQSVVQKILDKPSYEDESQNVTQRGSLGLQSKFAPKRNLIKINLSSSFGSKKKIFGNENKPMNLDANNDNSDYNPTISRMSLEEQINLTENKSPSHINADNFTESISDLEDERSYTPCLDENKSVKSKDTSLEDNDKGSTCIEGLETELISEDEGNELFSDPNRNEPNPVIVEIRRRNLESSHHPEFEEGEIVEKNKQKIKEKVKELLEKSEEKISDDDRKKKRRDKKNDKEDKERNSKVKNKKESDNIFKKLSKSGKERNYRERDDKGKGKDKRRSKSTDKENRDKKDRMREKKKEKRKDMERYDVRNIISDKNRRMKDAFGRDKSRPRSNSPSSRLQSPFRYRRSASRRRSPSHSRRSTSRPNESPSKERRSKSPHKFPSNSRRKQSMPRGLRSLSKEHKSVSPNGKQSNSIKRRSITPKSLESSKKRISLSPRARSPMIRNKISISPRNRRSISPRNRRSISPRIRRSVSPRNRRSVSPRNRRSVSPRNRRSISPRIRRSISPRNRRSISPRNRRSISPRMRRSKSRNKRSISRNRRSISRNRNKRIRRSVSRSRRISPKPHRNKSPRRRLSRRSRSKVRSISRNRSRSPKSKKLRKVKRARSDSNNRRSKSPIKSKVRRKRSRSFSPGVALSRSLSRDRLQSLWQETEKSPLFQDWTSGSQSMSPTRLRSPGLTPPLMEKSPEPQNLRVILTTKEKTKKKDKKKKSNKRNKTNDRVLKPSKDIGPSKEVFTSGNNILVSVSFNKNKEMDNVSNMPTTEIISKKKKRKTDNPIKQKKEKKDKIKKKRLEKDKRCKEIENKKPVAIIDLDKSPFKELTPSPKAVIVLSDSDNGEKEEEIRERQEILREKTIDIEFPQPESESIPNSPGGENNYVSSTGPKTPPEPPIKFTIISKSNPQLRSVNPLHEDEDETIEAEEANPPEEPTTARACESSYIGPNTPPDPPNSPPSSPDAYDPFEPTKSGSATPERTPNTVTTQSEPEKIPEVRPDELLSIPCMSLEAAQKSNLSADDVIQAKPISPTEKVMALLKSTRASLSPSNPMQQIFSDSTYETAKVDTEIPSAVNLPNMLQSPDMNSSSTITNKVVQPQSTYSAVVKPNSPKLIYSTVAPTYSTVAPTVMTSTPTYLNPSVPRIGAFNMGGSPSTQKPVPTLPQKITLPSPTKSSPLKSQPPKLFSTKPSPIKSTPIKPMVSSKTLISKLPMPTIKPIPRNQKINKTPNKSGQNGNETMSVNMDIDSPYSPGSSDFGDLFEPPSDNGKHNASAPASFPQKSTNKFETFDALFSIKPSSKNTKSSSTTKVSVRQIKKSKGKTVGVKVDEDSLKILDDLPSSAVEMQVKTKFLKKLNRQERVVEEVKLVLKPHYNKKHINKEEYKDILRRAVPKICHNRSGEINPAKIQALIEAYVRKFRKKSHNLSK